MESKFLIRTYTKAELGMLYFPKASKRTASRSLVKLMNSHPQLPKSLADTGMVSTCKVLTPAQVELIVDMLGLPCRDAWHASR